LPHYPDVAPVRVAFEDDSDLEVLDRVARACADMTRRNAENVRGTSVEHIVGESIPVGAG
jgi:hypothetical protein